MHRYTAAATLVLAGLCVMPGAVRAQATKPMPDVSSDSRSTIPEGDATKSGSSAETLGDKLNRTDGVISPPSSVDPGITKSPPSAGPKSMPVIPPLGAPGGPPGVTAK